MVGICYNWPCTISLTPKWQKRKSELNRELGGKLNRIKIFLKGRESVEKLIRICFKKVIKFTRNIQNCENSLSRIKAGRNIGTGKEVSHQKLSKSEIPQNIKNGETRFLRETIIPVFCVGKISVMLRRIISQFHFANCSRIKIIKFCGT